MQGAFNVEWDKVLEPGLDEETQRLYGGDKKLEPRRRRARGDDEPRRRRVRGDDEPRRRRAKGVRAGGDDDDDDDEEEEESESEDDDEGDDELPKRPPEPATMRFTTEGGLKFFVIPGAYKARVGKFGHYLTATTVTRWGERVPFPLPQGVVDVAPDTMGGGQVIYGGLPGFPQPPKAVYNEYEQNIVAARWDQAAGVDEASIPDDDQWDKWKHAPVHEMRDAARLVPPDHQMDFCQIIRSVYNEDPQNPQWHKLGDGHDRDPYPFPPNLDVCELHVHYTVSIGYDAGNVGYYEIGRQTLEAAVEDGERLDFAFAQRMQGLLGGAQDSVWACLDPGFNPLDRKESLHQFVATYTAGFYGTVSFEAEDGPRAVAVEALQQHRAFCQASWGVGLTTKLLFFDPCLDRSGCTSTTRG